MKAESSQVPAVEDNNLTEGRRVKAHFDVLKPHLKACNNKVK
ncbi:hypothetical protein SOVF_170470 [Spinacia oleracea]|nr:hypothetical protein SOVF_170470 [Spinacia oleracea]